MVFDVGEGDSDRQYILCIKLLFKNFYKKIAILFDNQ